MLVNLDHIEFYHGPPCQQSWSSPSQLGRNQLLTFQVPEIIQHPAAVGSVFAQESATLPLSANRPKSFIFQECGHVLTSAAEPWNIFDEELTNLHNLTEGSQSQCMGPAERHGRFLPNEDVSCSGLELGECRCVF